MPDKYLVPEKSTLSILDNNVDFESHAIINPLPQPPPPQEQQNDNTHTQKPTYNRHRPSALSVL